MQYMTSKNKNMIEKTVTSSRPPTPHYPLHTTNPTLNHLLVNLTQALHNTLLNDIIPVSNLHLDTLAPDKYTNDDIKLRSPGTPQRLETDIALLLLLLVVARFTFSCVLDGENGVEWEFSFGLLERIGGGGEAVLVWEGGEEGVVGCAENGGHVDVCGFEVGGREGETA